MEKFKKFEKKIEKLRVESKNNSEQFIILFLLTITAPMIINDESRIVMHKFTIRMIRMVECDNQSSKSLKKMF